MTVTMRDVARLAGVSPTTVSRVLNANYPVAATTRERVEAALKELDYVVNEHARALLHAHADVLGVVVNDIADPYFSAITRGVQDAAWTERKLVVICSTDGEPERELDYISLLRRQRAAAVILVGGSIDDPDYLRTIAAQADRMLDQGSRLIFCGRPAPTEALRRWAVPVDNRDGVRRATEYLIAHGHRRILHVTGPPGRSTTEQRLAGFLDAMRAAGLERSALVVPGDFSRATGHWVVTEAVRAGRSFTAVMATGDLVAIGALKALEELGVRVPAEVSVVGFDDVPQACDVTPPLTTVRVPMEAIGASAARLALAADPPSAPPRPLAVELVERASVGPAPGGAHAAQAVQVDTPAGRSQRPSRSRTKSASSRSV